MDIIGHKKLQKITRRHPEFMVSSIRNTRDQTVKEFDNFKITKDVSVNKNLTIDLGNRIVSKSQ